MRWTRMAVVGLVTAGIAMSASGPVSAAGLSIELPRSSELIQLTPAEQRQDNINGTKKLFPGVTDAQADSYNSSTDAIAKLAYEIDSDARNNFAHYTVARDINFSATLFLKNAPAATLEKINAAKVPGLNVINTAKYTEEEANALVRNAFEPVSKAKLAASVSAEYDWDRDKVTVEIAPPRDVPFSSIATRFSSRLTVPDIKDISGSPATVSIEYVQGGQDFASVMSGGTALSKYTGTGQTAVCTAGFSVVGQSGNAAGKSGILTAEHCGTTLAYEASTQLSAVTTYDGSVRGDARMFWASSQTVRRDFISRKTESGALVTKPALGKVKVGKDVKVCTYGTYSADQYSRGVENCDFVNSTGVDTDFVFEGYHYYFYNQTRTANGYTREGDSGGPWFLNNAAVGIQSAINKTGNTYNYSKFQPIDDAERKTGSLVLVN